MDTLNDLTAAIQEVAAHRSRILALLNLNPRVFDSWLHAATVARGGLLSQQSLWIIAAWIRGLPELGRARDTILRACAAPAQC